MGGVHGRDRFFAQSCACALDTSDTRLLSTPAITEGKIAFVYADDIWVANSDGENPRRVTSHPGEERNPFFAPMASTSRSQPATTATWTST